MKKTLKEKTVSAMAWNSLDRFGQQLLIVISGIILARLLSQAEYAIIGILAIFTAISTVIIDSGFGVALIREKNVQNTDFSTVFIFNLAIGVLLYLILFFAAPLIAWFYNEPSLISLSRVIFLTIPINALGVVQNTMLIKNIQFQITAKINIIAILLSGIVSISMAFSGYGVWALVFQALVLSISRTSLLWLWGKWKLSCVFDKQCLKRIFPFSANLLVSSLLNTILNNIYTAIIAKFYTRFQTGDYTQASKFGDVPSSLILNVINGTMFPILASISDDEERLKRASRKTIRTLAFLLFPITFGLVCAAKPLFVVVLTAKWESAVPYFQLLCMAAIFIPLIGINNNFLNIKGHSNIVLKLEVIKFIIIIVTLAITIRWGIINILIGLVIARCICYFISAFYAGSYTNYSLWEQFKDMFPYIAISFVMAFAMYSLTFFTDNLYILLLLQPLTGLLIYIVLNKMLGSKIYQEVIDLLKQNFLSIKK